MSAAKAESQPSVPPSLTLNRAGWTRWLGVRLAMGFIAVVLLIDVAAGTHAVLIGFLALAPLFAAAVESPRRTAVVSATATTAAVGAGLPSGMLGSLDHLLRVAVVITVSLMAVYVARARTGREERLRRMAEIVRITPGCDPARTAAACGRGGAGRPVRLGLRGGWRGRRPVRGGGRPGPAADHRR